MLTDERYPASIAVEDILGRVPVVLSAAIIGLFFICIGEPVNASSNHAEKLLARYVELEPALKNSAFKQPLVLQSTESPNSLVGEVYALINYPFAAVDAELKDADHWCDVLILHLNIKYCDAASAPSGTDLAVRIGTKREQTLEDSYALTFDFRQIAQTSDYFQIQLNAPEGPLSTRNFRIVLEAVPAGGNQTFLHLTYAYDYGFAGRLAMKSYLATIGRDKVGFTQTGVEAGAPSYVDGVRGLTERNTMRYYLAIDAYLQARNEPRDRFENSLQYWFAATERFPRQLHEVERSSYLAMKRREYARQHGLP